MAKAHGIIRKTKRDAAMQRRLERGRRKAEAKAARRLAPRRRWF